MAAPGFPDKYTQLWAHTPVGDVVDDDSILPAGITVDSPLEEAIQFTLESAGDSATASVYGFLKTTGGAINPAILGDVGLGDYITTAAYWENSDLGGAMYRVVAAATGTDDGGSYIDAGTVQLEAVFGDEINVAQFGAKGDGVADDTANLLAALAFTGSIGGGNTKLSRGTFRITALVSVPDHVNLVGAGGGFKSGGNTATVIACDAAGARLEWDQNPISAGNRGGRSGDFVVDGLSVATNPFRIGAAVQRTFADIQVIDAVGVGMVVESGQNNTFMNVNSERSPINIQVDLGAGGNSFFNCEYSTATQWNGVVQQSGASPSGYTVPTHNTFIGCIFERGDGNGCLYFTNGERITFRDCVFSKTGFTYTDGLIVMDRPSGTGSHELYLDNVWLHGGGGSVGIWQQEGGVYPAGTTRIQNVTTGWKYDGGYGHLAGKILYSGVTSEWGGAGNETSRPKVIGPPTAAISSTLGPALTLASYHAFAIIEMGSGASNTVTIPTDANVLFPVGTKIDVVSTGPGTTSIVAAAGVTLNEVVATTLGMSSAQYASVTLYKKSSDKWVATGALADTDFTTETGVAVTAAGIHAALVNLGLITA